MGVAEVAAAGPSAKGALFRGLSRRDIFALTLNNIVGAGVFTMPAALAAGAGSWSVAVLLLAIGLVAMLAVCGVEVASRYSATGGPMVYAGEAFGPSAGFVVGWLMFLSRISAFGAIASTMFDYAAGLWPVLDAFAVRAAVLTAFVGIITAVNLRGVVHAAVTVAIFTVAKSVPLVLLAVGGLWITAGAALPPPPPSSLDAVGSALLVAVFACMGFEPAMVLAGEVRSQRDLPVGLLGGLAAAAALYVLLVVTCFRTVPDLAQSARPLAAAAVVLMGPAGATLVLITAVIACGGSLSGWMTASPRVLYALAVQRDVPHLLATVHPRYHTPSAAILVSAVLVWVMTLSGTFIYLASFSAITRLLTYASTAAALPVLRRRLGAAPLPIPGGPSLAVAAVATVCLTLGSLTGAAIRDVVIALALGWVWRSVSRRRLPALVVPGARR